MKHSIGVALVFFYAFAANGGNCIRLWAGHRSLEVMPEKPGVYDPETTKTIKGIIKLCEELGVKVKITLESFRSVNPAGWKGAHIYSVFFNRPLYSPYAKNMRDFFASEQCRKFYLGKAEYLKSLGFGDSPAVYCWELWNEINAAGPMDIVCASATKEMLDRRPDRPAILAESGAVKANHTGPSEFYANDGRSAAKPLKSLAKAGMLPLKPGDSVLFKRGDLFRGFFRAKQGVTYSAWGEGPKPTLCGSLRDYADPSLWATTAVANVWCCTEKIVNAGCIFFDFDPCEVGRQDVVYGKMALPERKEPYDKPMTLDEDLAFRNLFREDALLLRSDKGNPGLRFKHIEIGSIIEKHILCAYAPDVTVDNIHFTCCGGNAVGNHPGRNFEVRNCVFNHLGGSVLLGWKFGTVRFGNAVEIWDGIDGYSVHDNWMYQIYDTGITHQRNHTADFVCVMKNVKYWGNLVERCFWAIEYYNQYNAPGSRTEDIYVHDNFCRFSGEGWGCPGREKRAPMYSFGNPPSFTKNYRTERNIFDRSTGFIFFQYGDTIEPKGAHTFKCNTYIQRSGDSFASVRKEITPFTPEAAPRFVESMFGETAATFIRLPTVRRK